MSAARTLFVRPLEIEDGGGALGDFFTPTQRDDGTIETPDLMKFILGVTGGDVALDIIERVTSTAPEEAVARQTQRSQRLEIARSARVAAQRGDVWASVAPWAFLAVGVVGVSVILGVAATRKKGGAS